MIRISLAPCTRHNAYSSPELDGRDLARNSLRGMYEMLDKRGHNGMCNQCRYVTKPTLTMRCILYGGTPETISLILQPIVCHATCLSVSNE